MVLGKTNVWLVELLPASFGTDDSNDAYIAGDDDDVDHHDDDADGDVLHPQMIGWAVKPPTRNNSQYGI